MAKKKRARFAINVDSGVVVFRSESTDALKTLWKLIDDETASAIVKKKISARDVIEAIQKAIVRDDGFNWREYDKKRKEELKLFNVSERDMVPVEDVVSNGADKEEPEDTEVLSLKDLGFGGEQKKQRGKPSGKTTEDPRPEKPEDKPPANKPEDKPPANKPEDKPPANKPEDKPSDDSDDVVY